MRNESNQQPSRLIGEKLRCIGRRVSKPRLFHYTHNHRAIMVEIDGYPAVCEVLREWKIIKRKT